MKRITFLLLSTVSPLLLNAQITLNATNAPSVAQCQIQDTFNIVSPSSLPNLSPASNATWDMTTVMSTGTSYHYNQAASFSAFPNATFNIPAYYPFAGSLSYNINNLFDVTSNGIIHYGEHMVRQPISIAALSGGANDSLVFAMQDIVYTPNHVYLKYPCTMGTNWVSSYNSTTNFNLTVAAFSINNVPGQRRSTTTYVDSVVGWGKMRVNDLSGNPSGYMNVLQLKVIYTVADSFYLNGSPAPTTILTAFGLTQGQKTIRYTYSFFRAGEFKELTYVEYSDSTFTTPTYCETHEQRLASPASVTTLTKDQIRVYPNPVVNNTVTVKLNSVKNKASHFALLNTVGQEVASGDIPSDGVIHFSNAVSSGIYFLKVVADDGAVGTTTLNILH